MVKMSNLANTFTENAAANADKTAIFWGDEQVTFGQAHTIAVGLAKRLKEEFGLKPGDRVGLWLKNCPEFIYSLFGILLAEGVVVGSALIDQIANAKSSEQAVEGVLGLCREISAGVRGARG